MRRDLQAMERVGEVGDLPARLKTPAPQLEAVIHRCIHSLAIA